MMAELEKIPPDYLRSSYKAAEAARVWRDIPLFEGMYEVSTHGEVRSKLRRVTYANGTEALHQPRMLRQSVRGGYPCVTLSKNDKQHREAVHRLVLKAFRPLKDYDHTVADHINGDKLDNYLGNLRWVSQRQNNQNTRKHRAGKTLGVIQRASGRWQARITVEGKRHSLGTFDSEKEAHVAYLAKLNEIGEMLCD